MTTAETGGGERAADAADAQLISHEEAIEAAPRLARMWTALGTLVAMATLAVPASAAERLQASDAVQRPTALGYEQLLGPEPGRDRHPAIIALDPRTGEKRWRAELDDQPGVIETAYVADDLIIAEQTACVRAPQGHTGEEGRVSLVAVDGDSGERRWRVAVEYHFGHVGDSYADVFGDGGPVVPALGSNGNLLGLNAKTGKRRWKLSLEGVAPAVGNRRALVLRGSDELQVVERRTGDVLWDYTVTEEGLEIQDEVAVGSDTVIVSLAPFGVNPVSERRGLDVRTGRELWRLPASEFPNIESTGIEGRFAVSSNYAGGVTGYEASTGRQLWHFADANIAEAGPRGSDLVLAINSLTADKRIMALDARTGEVRWSRPGDQFESIIAARKGLLLTGSEVSPTEQRLTAIDIDTGETRWQRQIPRSVNTVAVGDLVYVADRCALPS
jgi:outer membrane protein assembly factor BamB